MAEPAYDIFVSYAHADDEIPAGAKNGWVTTLVAELNKVLRRKLGGSGARIWMDHQLAANANVLDTLLATLRGSRILLLVMSPGYHQSVWCQRELGNFLAQSAAEKHKDNVFVVDFEPVPREAWHSALQALTTLRFWERGFTDKVPRPLGFPVPKLDEDNPYWRNVNELAHLIAEYLRQNAARTPESRAAILLAETTEDLLDHRDAVAVFLRQQGIDVLPSVDYPRDARAVFVSAVQRDLARSLAFVQLLGPYEGRRPPDDSATFVVLQADQALLLQQQRAMPILQWRTSEVEPERIANPTYRELVGRRTVQTGGLEQFKQEILRVLQPQPLPSSAPPSLERRPAEPASGTTRDLDGTDVCIYVNADQVDSAIASQVSDSLKDTGVDALLSPEPDPGQPPEKMRGAQQALLEGCSGVVLVYGQTPATWVQAQFAFTRRVIAPHKRGVWGALLDVAPQSRPRAPLRSPNLLTLDCRQGLDTSKLARFVELLRQNGGSHA
jgi:TIR domain